MGMKKQYIILFKVIILSVWNSNLCASDWQLDIHLDKNDCHLSSTIGVADKSIRISQAPIPPVFECSLFVAECENNDSQFNTDIRSSGEDNYYWVLAINPKGNVSTSSKATVSWDINHLGPGSFQIREGIGCYGDIIVFDMKIQSSFESISEDNEYVYYTIMNNVTYPSYSYLFEDNADSPVVIEDFDGNIFLPLKMSAWIDDYYITAKIEKFDGTYFSEGDICFLINSFYYSPQNIINCINGFHDYSQTFRLDLNSINNMNSQWIDEKIQFFARYDNTYGDYSWVGPLKIERKRKQEKGSLQITIRPQSAIESGAMWAFQKDDCVWSPWYESGQLIKELDIGLYIIRFKNIPLWETPQEDFIIIESNQLAYMSSRFYFRKKTSIQFTIEPATVNESGAKCRAKYPEPAGFSVWVPNGYILSGFSPGNTLIQCSNVEGWFTPEPEEVIILEATNNIIDITYCRIIPEKPVNVVATRGNFTDKVVITWNSANFCNNTYNIYRSKSSVDSIKQLIASNWQDTTYEDSSAEFGYLYYYTIAEKNLINEGDYSDPVIGYKSLGDLSNDLIPTKSKTWNWGSNENCTFRFSIDQSESWNPTGAFENIVSATIDSGNGKWYLHVQAKDASELTSDVLTVYCLLDNTKPVVNGINDDSFPVKSKTWTWRAIDQNNCLFRYAIDQNESWSPSGEFKSITSATQLGTYGKWYIHVQAKDMAGNVSDVVSVSTELKKSSIKFDPIYAENSESYTTVNIQLHLSHISLEDTYVVYEPSINLSEEHALEGQDYHLPDDNFVIIKAGELIGNLPLTVIDDNYSENNEIIELSLIHSTSNAELDRRNHFVYKILDNDNPGILVFESDNQTRVFENGESDSFTIVLNTKPQHDVEIFLTNHPLVNIEPDYIYIKSNQWDIPQTVIISGKNDNIYRGNFDIELILQTDSKDLSYAEENRKIFVQIMDDDPEAKPPEVFGPNTPYNDHSPKWTWTSGGGSKTYRYKLNDDDLDIDATETNNTWFQPTYGLTQGFHTLYVQEFNEYTNQWSDSDFLTIEIDTGLPCSSIVSISPINTVSKQLTIIYNYDDIYWGESCGNAISGSGIEKVELWVSEPETNQYEKMITDTVIDGLFTYTVSQEGMYKFHVCAVDKANNSEMNNPPDPNQVWDGESFYTNNFSGYAFLAVGSIAGQEGLASHTLTANNIYKQLIHRNFWPEHIKYFNPYEERQPGETDFDKHGGTYYKAFEQVISQWAPEQIKKLPGPIYIILIDHGSPDIFHLTGTQFLTAYKLDKYLQVLDNLENKKEIIIILGTCFSGSFIDDISAKGRIIVTSAAENEPSYRGPKINPGGVRDGGFFISNLFNELAKGNNLLDSFNTAVLRTEFFTFSMNTKTKAPFNDFALQHPLLDDNGQNGSNFLPLNGDGYIAQNIILGHNENQTVKNYRITMTPKQLNYNENTLNVEVTVNDTDHVKRLWIEIRKPDISLEDMRLKDIHDHAELQQFVELEEFDLVFNPQKENYSLKLDRFDIPGQYMIFFYVKDKEDITSGFKESVVYKSKEKNQSPLKFSPISPMINNDTELSDVILEWENTRDPENDKISYSVILSTDTDTIIKEHIFSTIYFVSLPQSWDKKEVFWKVQAIDHYGNITETPQWRFTINNNVDTWGTITYFQVYDMDTQMPVPNAKVNIVFNYTNLDLMMHSNGVYIKRFFRPGLYKVAVIADNYTPLHNESIEIIPGQIQSFNFSLDFQSSLGDINRNGKRDIGDAIMCLQVISGVDENFYYYDPEALTADVIELRDAIFILQMLSEVY